MSPNEIIDAMTMSAQIVIHKPEDIILLADVLKPFQLSRIQSLGVAPDCPNPVSKSATNLPNMKKLMPNLKQVNMLYLPDTSIWFNRTSASTGHGNAHDFDLSAEYAEDRLSRSYVESIVVTSFKGDLLLDRDHEKSTCLSWVASLLADARESGIEVRTKR